MSLLAFLIVGLVARFILPGGPPMRLDQVGDRLLALSVAAQVDVFAVGAHPGGGPLSRLGSVSRDVVRLALRLYPVAAAS